MNPPLPLGEVGVRRAPGEGLLSVSNLRTWFRTRNGIVKAVDGLSFHINPGETLAVVGESGCGKSMTALSLMRLVPAPGRIESGSIRLGVIDLLRLPLPEMRKLRGNDIAMIFQEPMTSLNPVLTVGRQIAEAIELHRGLSPAKAMDHAIHMLRRVHIPEPEQRAREYPHQLSGGMRQRAMIAMALACNPKLLIADEPTTALDVTIQAQILRLILELQQETGAAMLLITHDLGVVAETAHRVIVMYAGRKVEEAPVDSLFATPQHPYMQGLLASIPRTGQATPDQRLAEIPGIVPPLHSLPPGCHFAPRCPRADARCHAEYPVFEAKRPNHFAACWNAGLSRHGRA
jgi:peptide/nickel transport system ATP-binding protein